MSKKKKATQAPIAAVGVSDIHLKKRIWNSRPIEYDTFFALAQAVDFAIANSARQFLLLGDVLDSCVVGSEPVVFLARQFEKLSDAGIQILGIDGNHDSISPSWLTVSSKVLQVDGQHIDIPGGRALFLNYSPPAVFKQRVKQLCDESTTQLIAHQSWVEMWPATHHCDCSLTALPYVQRLISGDYHRHLVTGWYKNATGQNIHGYSPGSLCMQSINENPDKFFFALLDDEWGTFKQFPVVTRKYFETPTCRFANELEEELTKLKAAVEESLNDASLPEALKVPLLRVMYDKRVSDARKIINSVFKNLSVHVFENPINLNAKVTTKEADQALSVAHAQGLLGLLAKTVSPASGVFKACERFWTTDDVAAAYTSLKQEVLDGSLVLSYTGDGLEIDDVVIED